MIGEAWATDPVDERLEELDVVAVQVAHQVDDGVGLARAGRRRRRGALASVRAEVSSSAEPSPGVSMRVSSASFGDGPADLDPLDRRAAAKLAEIDVERAVLAR